MMCCKMKLITKSLKNYIIWQIKNKELPELNPDQLRQWLITVLAKSMQYKLTNYYNVLF